MNNQGLLKQIYDIGSLCSSNMERNISQSLALLRNMVTSVKQQSQIKQKQMQIYPSVVFHTYGDNSRQIQDLQQFLENQIIKKKRLNDKTEYNLFNENMQNVPSVKKIENNFQQDYNKQNNSSTVDNNGSRTQFDGLEKQQSPPRSKQVNKFCQDKEAKLSQAPSKSKRMSQQIYVKRSLGILNGDYIKSTEKLINALEKENLKDNKENNEIEIEQQLENMTFDDLLKDYHENNSYFLSPTFQKGQNNASLNGFYYENLEGSYIKPKQTQNKSNDNLEVQQNIQDQYSFTMGLQQQQQQDNYKITGPGISPDTTQSHYEFKEEEVVVLEQNSELLLTPLSGGAIDKSFQNVFDFKLVKSNMVNGLSNKNNTSWNLTPLPNINKQNWITKTKTVTKLYRNEKQIPDWAVDLSLVEQEWKKQKYVKNPFDRLLLQYLDFGEIFKLNNQQDLTSERGSSANWKYNNVA